MSSTSHHIVCSERLEIQLECDSSGVPEIIVADVLKALEDVDGVIATGLNNALEPTLVGPDYDSRLVHSWNNVLDAAADYHLELLKTGSWEELKRVVGKTTIDIADTVVSARSSRRSSRASDSVERSPSPRGAPSPLTETSTSTPAGRLKSVSVGERSHSPMEIDSMLKEETVDNPPISRGISRSAAASRRLTGGTSANNGHNIIKLPAKPRPSTSNGSPKPKATTLTETEIVAMKAVLRANMPHLTNIVNGLTKDLCAFLRSDGTVKGCKIDNWDTDPYVLPRSCSRCVSYNRTCELAQRANSTGTSCRECRVHRRACTALSPVKKRKPEDEAGTSSAPPNKKQAISSKIPPFPPSTSLHRSISAAAPKTKTKAASRAAPSASASQPSSAPSRTNGANNTKATTTEPSLADLYKEIKSLRQEVDTLKTQLAGGFVVKIANP